MLLLQFLTVQDILFESEHLDLGVGLRAKLQKRL
jgi:hypothetical protein